MKEYRGGCHCGIVQLTYRTGTEPADWPLRHDGCSFCRRHGVVGTSDANGEVTLKISDASKVRQYRFGQKSADFVVCGECGVFVAAVTESNAGKRAVINARVIDGIALDFSRMSHVSFDDESASERSARRARYWTPVRA